MKINASLSALANIVALVNDANPSLNLTVGQVTIGSASAYTPGSGDLNSQIALTGVDGQGWDGSVTIHYKRPVLQAGGAWPSATGLDILDVPASSLEADALAQAVAQLGLVATEVTSSAYTAPVEGASDGSLTITANAGSPLYTGSAVLVLKAANSDQPLSNGVTTTDMNGFDNA